MTYTCEVCHTTSREPDEPHNTKGQVKARERWCVCCKGTRFHYAAPDLQTAAKPTEEEKRS